MGISLHNFYNLLLIFLFHLIFFSLLRDPHTHGHNYCKSVVHLLYHVNSRHSLPFSARSPLIIKIHNNCERLSLFLVNFFVVCRLQVCIANTIIIEGVRRTRGPAAYTFSHSVAVQSSFSLGVGCCLVCARSTGKRDGDHVEINDNFGKH